MSLRSSMAKELLDVITGKESPTQAVLTLFLIAIGDTLLTKDVLTMDFIFIPEGSLIPVIAVLAVMAVAGPVLCALYMKNKSKNQFSEWFGVYGVTMVIDMFITPSLGLICMSLLAQKIEGMSNEQYLVFLPIVCLIVSYIALSVMNNGVKSTIEQVKKTKLEVLEGMEELKKN